MKRFTAFAVALLLLITSFSAAGTDGISLGAEASALYCVDDGKFYYSENENKRMKPASTTKLMTALLTLEYAAEHNRRVRFREDMIAEGSSMYLKLGEVVTLRDLAVGLMLCSGNDAANAAAVSIAGSREKFAALMNRRARKIGMKNTHFVTPSGLDDDNHYSTAHDMALLMAEALKNRELRRVMSLKTSTVSFKNPPDKRVTYSNHNRLLSDYEHCIGGKTGYTMAAGRCLVTAARKDGLTFVAVTLNDKNDWSDHKTLFEYGFSSCRMKALDDRDFYLDIDTVGGLSDKTTLYCDGVTRIVLPAKAGRIKRRIYADNFLYAPVAKGKAVGRIAYFLNGKIIAEHKLLTAENNSLEE